MTIVQVCGRLRISDRCYYRQLHQALDAMVATIYEWSEPPTPAAPRSPSR